MSWLSNYKYRKQFSVSRASGAVVDYQIKINVGSNENCTGNNGFFEEWHNQPYATYQTTVNSILNGVLDVTSYGSDPHLDMYSIGSFNPAIYKYFVVRYKVISGIPDTKVEFFFLNSRRTSPNADQALWPQFYLNNDGEWHTYIVDASVHQYWSNSNITGWRFDWATKSGVRLQIDYIGLVDSVDVNCNNHCLESFNDLRFTNESGSILNYWIEKIYGESPNLSATVWVKFDVIETTETTFYMYYNKPDASSFSNGTNTFIKFEDFEWGSNGTNLNTSGGSVTWVQNSTPSAIISTEKTYKGTRSGKLTGATAFTYYSFEQELTDNIAFSLWFYKETAVLNGPNIGIGGTKCAGFWIDLNENVMDVNSNSTGFTIYPDTWQKVECYNIDITSSTYDININNMLTKTNARMTTGEAVFRLLNASTTVGHDVWVDEIIIRHYRQVEPVLGVFGDEETFNYKTSWSKFIYKENIAKKMYLGSTLVYEQRMGDPTILDAPSLWLDADDSETLIMSGSDVAQWSDKSSNSYHAVASTGRPSLSSLNGKTTVYSTINEGLWHTSAKSLLRNRSAAITAIVFSTIPSTSYYRFGFTNRGQTGSPIQARVQLLANAGNHYGCSSMRLDSDTIFSSIDTSFTADYNYHIAVVLCFWETGKLYFYFDGSYIGESAYTSSGNTSDTDVYTGPGTWLMVGGCGIGDYALQGGVGEIIVLAKSSGIYDTHWGTILEGYLAHKWGLTGNLPSDHDFKNNAPNWAFQS